MKLSIRLYGHLYWYHNKDNKPFELELEGNPTLLEILNMLKIPESEVSVASVNGMKESWGYRPKEGEVIEYFPVISGG